MRVFLDTSCIIAAVLSQTGGSFRIVSEAEVRGITIIVSRYVIREAEKNILLKYPECAESLLNIASSFTFVRDPSLRDVKRLSEVVDKDDAPVLGAALLSRADALLTLDHRDFIQNIKVQKSFPLLKIMTPGEFIKEYFV
ncbi:MAG: hypothetical protein G01um101430_588 [Parcubacteria group bacterium Gr01-1014_30]|nr:MAG: hypothetical protein G01um101430_588 [Parcubacteria group bacterium Gr01-1014_30]